MFICNFPSHVTGLDRSSSDHPTYAKSGVCDMGVARGHEEPSDQLWLGELDSADAPSLHVDSSAPSRRPPTLNNPGPVSGCRPLFCRCLRRSTTSSTWTTAV